MMWRDSFILADVEDGGIVLSDTPAAQTVARMSQQRQYHHTEMRHKKRAGRT